MSFNKKTVSGVVSALDKMPCSGALCAQQQVMFKPAVQCVLDNLTAAGADSCVMTTDSDAELGNFLGDADILAVFRGEAALIGKADIDSALEQHCDNEYSVTAVVNTDEEAIGVIFNAAVVSGSVAQAYTCKPSGRYTVSRFERCGAVISDALSLHAVNETAQRRQVDHRLNDGVIIPFTDGVIIGPDAQIAAGATVLPGSIIVGASKIGKGSVIGPNSTVRDSVIGENTEFKQSVATDSVVGNGAHIGPFTQLRPNSTIEDGVKIGDFVEVKNSRIGERTSLAHLTYIGDADIGKCCNFGCGVVVVNYDGECKNRTVVKDYAFIGCNTNLVAPVSVGEGAFTAAGSTITRDVPDGALAIERGTQTLKEGWAAKKLSKYFEKHHRNN